MTDLTRIFTVNGQPFYPLGGQARNSSGYNDSESETAFKAIKLLHGNTLEIPVYWDQVEPEEGRFDFSSVDVLLANARRYGVKLILLWFATWKNGTMDYAPAWVKTDPQRFKRVTSVTGQDLWVLSSHCQANLVADKKAFAALCNHLKDNDSAERTVIALQIQNEPGIIASDRDYGPEAQAEFDRAVPGELVKTIKEANRGRVFNVWQAAGGKDSGSWPELFGWAAGEFLSAYSIATYIDTIAEAGKAVFDIPMYINAWLEEVDWMIAGEDYPAGGGVSKVLDIYKWFTPHVDLIAPDIYLPDSRGYESICATYARHDNPLFVPESPVTGANAWNMFRAIADYNVIGYALFGIEHMMTDDDSIHPDFQMVADSVRAVAAAIPLLLKYQGTGKIHAVIQEENMLTQWLNLDGYLGFIHFGDGPRPRTNKDWRHSTRLPHGKPTAVNRGRGLVIQTSQQEFYLVGVNYRLFLRSKQAPSQMRASSSVSAFMLHRLAHYLSVDEGHFAENGEFVIDRRRNGDEINYGTWVEADTGVVRVRMCD